MKPRILTPSDVTAFRRLRLEAIRDSPAAFLQTEDELGAMSDEDLGKWIECSENRATVGVFDDGGRMIAMSGFRRDSGRKVRHKAIISSVFVAPSSRGKRIGRIMLEFLISEARTRNGLQQLLLSVADSQHAAIRLYQSIGFESYGHEPRAVYAGEQYVSEELMILMLNKS